MLKTEKTMSALVLAATMFAGLPAAHADTSKLEIVVEQARNLRGRVRCGLYNQPDGYPTEPQKALRKAAAPVVRNRATIVFENLEAGAYAVACYHDEDNNNEMKANFIGIPQEGTAASNDAEGSFGPPSFKDAALKYSGGALQHRIKLTY